MSESEQRGSEGVAERDRGVVGDPRVSGDLSYLADRDREFLERRPEVGDERWAAFDEHRRRLSELRAAMREAGVSERDRRIFEQFYGFHEEGREEVSTIAGEHSITVQEVGDAVCGVTQGLARVGWQPAGR
ncbi:MAG TPA: hypothetical protein VIF43_01435 [Patescibacteria group bacterium]|jgi:hypothetical protein